MSKRVNDLQNRMVGLEENILRTRDSGNLRGANLLEQDLVKLEGQLIHQAGRIKVFSQRPDGGHLESQDVVEGFVDGR